MNHIDDSQAGGSILETSFDLLFGDGARDVVSDARGLDASGDADHLTGVLGHLAGVRAAADYRILVAASQLHEECEEEYLIALAEHRGERESTADAMSDAAARAAVGEDPFEKYGPDGIERATAHLGAALNVTPGVARRLIESGHALRYRLPRTGELLALARIDRARFDAVVSQTDLVDEEARAALDEALADEIGQRPPMSFARFTTLVDAVIARIDPEALVLRAERASRDRAITVKPDRRVPGQARIAGRIGSVDGARVNAALDAGAKDVHPDDPRTLAQRRADAFVALAQGRAPECRCARCVTERSSAAADDRTCGTLPAEPQTGAWFHVVVNLSTLVGADNDPAFVDGQGLIDAATARDLLAEARRSYVHTASGGGTGRAYQASPRLADLIRCGELWCSFPGCANPAWSSDLDHLVEYDHSDPDRGGRTEASNLAPLCRLHHRIKTFTDWRDYRDRQGRVVVVTPAGRLIAAAGFAGHDLFPDLKPPGPGGAGLACLQDQAGRERARLRRRRRAREDSEPPPPY